MSRRALPGGAVLAAALEALEGVWDPKKTPRIVELDTVDGTDGPGRDLLENMRKWNTGVLNTENIASHQTKPGGS